MQTEPTPGGPVAGAAPVSPVRSVVGVLAVTAWSIVVALGFSGVAGMAIMGDLACEAEDGWVGEVEWTLLPPGPRCTFSDGGDHGVDDMRPVMSTWLVVILGGWGCARLLRRTRAPRAGTRGDRLPFGGRPRE